MFDQVECARAWAKVLAYRRCGKDYEARIWWERLSTMLWDEDVSAEPKAPFRPLPEIMRQAGFNPGQVKGA